MKFLIDPTELAGMLGDVTVLDVRWALPRKGLGEQDHLAGHIPGAAFVDMDSALADPHGPGTGRHPLPDGERFAEAMRRCGVSRDRTVVVCDDAGGTSAARAWWLLRYHNHPDVRLLDGCWSGWVAEGLPTQTGPVVPAYGDFQADPGHLPVVDADGAARVAETGGLVDVRVPERFRGETEPVDPVAGRIPGAVNVPAPQHVYPPGHERAGRIKDPADLAVAYGAVQGDDAAVYCGSGVAASLGVLALALLDRPAALYAGSWSEWITDPQRPVAKG